MSRRRRFAPLFVAIVVMGLGALLGSRITMDNDISRLLPDSSPEMTRATKALQRLMNQTIVDVSSTDGSLDHQALGALADEFANRLMATGHVTRVRSRMDADDALPMIELLREHAPLLMDAAALREIEKSIARDQAVETIQHLARRIQEIDGAHLKARARIDPLGLTDRALAPLSGLGEAYRSARLIDGRMTSVDGKHILVIVEVGCAPNEADRNQAYLTELQGIVTYLEIANAGARIRFFGSHRATLDNVQQIRADVYRTSAIGISVVALLAFLCFGRVWLSLLALTPALFGGLFAFGTFSLFKDSVSGAVLGFGAVLLGLTIDFAVHVLFRIDRSTDEKVSLPVRELYMGGTTTSLAFVALQASSLPALRDIGIFGAIGIFSAVMFALYVLPTLVVGPRRARPIIDLQRIVEKIARPRMPTMIVALLATPIIALGIFSLEFDGDPTNLSALTPAAAEDDRTIQSVWGQGGQMTALVVEGSDVAAALAANDRLRAWLDQKTASGGIRKHASISALLPAPATQLARRRAWKKFWTTTRRAELQETLDAATAASLFRPGAFSAFVDWLDKAPEILTYDQQIAGPMQPLLTDRIYSEDGVWRVTTPVFTETWEQTAALDAALRSELPGVTLLNRQAFARKLASMVTGEVGILALFAFLLVGTVVFLWHGRILVTAAVLTPLLLSLVWTLGLLGWFGLPISLANAIFVVFLFGVAVDYAIFLAGSRLERFRTGKDHTKEAQASVLLCTLTTCGGFGSLAAAGHPVMHSIGLTALIGILSTALATQIFVPALMGSLLGRGGANGTPGIPNVRAGFWVFRLMVVRGIWHLLTHRKGSDAAASQRAAIDSIHRMAVKIRHHLPFGRPVFVDEDKLTDEPCIIVANHESMYDIIGVLALPKPIRILVKEWVWKMPVMGHMVRRAGYVVTNDGDPTGMFEKVRQRIANGSSLLVFQEGKRTRTGRIGRFHNGAFAMARELGVKVQPIAMVNTRDVVPYRAWWLGDHDARICVLDPMDPNDFTGEGGDRRMARAARDRIRERCGELWLDTQFGDRWWAMVGGMYRYLGPMITHYAISKCKRDPLIRELPRLCLRGDNEEEGRILVAGGGMGLMTNRLALAFPDRPITCIDFDERKLQFARAALGTQHPVDFVVADLRTCKFPAVDLALLIDVLHYWDDATQRKILSRVAGALRPGGRLLFRDGCSTGDTRHKLLFAQERFATFIGFTRDQGKLLFRTEPEWRALLGDCGFDVENSRDDLGSLSNVFLVCSKRADVVSTTTETPGETVSH